MPSWCTVPEQKRTWSACRFLANHKHPIRAQIGLSIDTKAALDHSYIQQANGPGIFIKKLCEPEFPSDIRSVLFNRLNITNKDQMKKFKKQCQNYVSLKKSLKKQKKIANPDIGDNQSDFVG